MSIEDVRRADGPLHLRLPARGRGARHALGVPAAASACPAPRTRRSTASASTAAAARSTRACVAHDELDWAPLGSAAGVFLNLMTSRLADAGAELADPAAATDRGGGMAVELLLLPGGAAAAGVPVLVRRRRSGARRSRRRSASPSAARPAARSPSTSSRSRMSTCRSGTTTDVGVVEHVFPEDAAPGRSRRSAPSSTRHASTRGA